MLKALLEVPCSAETSPQLRGGASYSLLDVFDRRVERVFFVEVLNSAMLLSQKLYCLGTLGHCIDDLASGKMSTTRLNDAVKGITEQAEGHKARLNALMEQVYAMPQNSPTKN